MALHIIPIRENDHEENLIRQVRYQLSDRKGWIGVEQRLDASALETVKYHATVVRTPSEQVDLQGVLDEITGEIVEPIGRAVNVLRTRATKRMGYLPSDLVVGVKVQPTVIPFDRPIYNKSSIHVLCYLAFGAIFDGPGQEMDPEERFSFEGVQCLTHPEGDPPQVDMHLREQVTWVRQSLHHTLKDLYGAVIPDERYEELGSSQEDVRSDV